MAQQPQEVAQEKRLYTSKEEVIARLKELSNGEEEPTKTELEHLKTAFYHLLNNEREAAQKAYLDAGGDPMQYAVLPDPLEEEFKAEMNIIKERRQQAIQKLEEEKQRNLKRKKEILERIKELTTTPEEAANAFQEVKQLQQ